MNKYEVLLTRYMTESCCVIVEGATQEAAEEAACERGCSDTDLVWEPDDISILSSGVYVTNCVEISNVDSA